MAKSGGILQDLIERIEAANRAHRPLHLVGGDTKCFYGRETRGERLSIAELQGIIAYEPTELVLTARAGTRLTEIEAVLASRGQMLAFEPPRFGSEATLGGMVAAGLSGPRRPYVGAVRDFVLGVKCLTASGQVLSFGGQVMKNVAGYDVSRLMAGALGTLGILLEVSLKVLPRPEHEITLRRAASLQEAIDLMNTLAGEPLPLSGACYDGATLYLRLSGMHHGVAAARSAMGGDELREGESFWPDVREQRLPFFTEGGLPLWRLSVPPATPPIDIEGDWLIDWGGAQRWLRSYASPKEIRQAASERGGYATLFRGGDRQGEVFAKLTPALEQVHRRLKRAFDPNGILNPGRLYSYL